MAATARSVCASAPNIPIIADAGKVSNFLSKVSIFCSDKKKVSIFGSKVSNLLVKFQTLVQRRDIIKAC